MNTVPLTMSFNTIRRFFNEIHLWLGVTSGALVSVICLSGAIFVFYPECQFLAEPSKFRIDIPKNAVPLPVDELIEHLENERGMRVAGLTIPQRPNRAWTFRLISHTEPRRAEWLYVDPYTGKIVGTGQSPVDPFFFSVRSLHQSLWLPPQIGRPLVGWITIIFIVVVLSGFILWLPRTWKSFARWRAWTFGLKIQFRKGTWKLVYDLHNTLGFYTLVPLLILALTGLCWSFSWYRDAVSNLLGEYVFLQFQPLSYLEPPVESTKSLTIGEMIDRQNRLMPEPGELVISIPSGNSGTVVIQKGSTGFFSIAVKDRVQWDRFHGTVIPIEHYGRVVEIERFGDKPFGAKIAATIRALHYGEITGLSSKIVFFVACLFATSFPITGTALWIRKLLAERRRSRPP